MKRITLIAITAICFGFSYAQKTYYNIKYNGRVYEVSYTSYDKSIIIYPLLEDVYKEKAFLCSIFAMSFGRMADGQTY